MTKRTMFLAISIAAAAGCGGNGTTDGGSDGSVGAPDLSGAVTDGGDTGDMTFNPDNDAGLAVACATAMPLDVSSGSATVTGDLSKAPNGTSGTCGGIDSGEILYKIVLTKPQSLTATLIPVAPSTMYIPVVYVRGSNCVDESDTNEYLCSAAISSLMDTGGVVTADSTATGSAVVSAGTYYVGVDGYGGSAGQFKLTIKLDPPPPPPANDSCAAAAALAFANGTATATADLSTAKDDAKGSCGGMGGPDAVWTFTTTMLQSVTITVDQDPSTATYQPVVYLRKACASTASSDELGCNDAAGAGSATFRVGSIPAGTYFVWVDASTARGGKLKLTVVLGPPAPPNDTCAMPAPITLTANTGMVNVDTTSSTDDTSGNCGGTGNDDVYTIVVPQESSLTATLTPDSSTPMYQPLLYLRMPCDDKSAGDAGTAKEYACSIAPDVAKPVTMHAYDLMPGTYFLWVDGYASSMGKGALTVTLAAPVKPPANNGCSAPTMVSAGQTVTGDTGPSTDKMGAMISMVCDVDFLGAFPGNDQTYLLKPTADGTVNITVTSDGTWDPAVYVIPTTCDATGATCTVAADASTDPKAPEMIALPVKANTSYYIVVDSGDPSQAGPFHLALQ